MTKFIVILALLFPSISLAMDYATANKKIVESFAIPKQQHLAETSDSLVQQIKKFCAKPEQEQFEATQKQFIVLMDSWQRAQLLRLGPSEMYMRHFRLQMWPDRSNSGAKQIAQLLANADPEALKPEVFSQSSTAVQGISALERLLFGKKAQTENFLSDGKPNYRCQLVTAIALNINQMSLDIVNEWQAVYAKAIAEPSEDNDYFETHKEVSAHFLKQMATELQFVVDKKINRPLTENKLRSTMAESWRSKQSLHNMLANIESVRSLYQLGFHPLLADVSIKQKLDQQFDEVIKTGKTLNISMAEAYKKQKPELELWVKQIKVLKNMVIKDLPKALDIPLGFNSLDGD